MKIDVLPRTYFEERMGTDEVARLLQTHKVISIQSSRGWDSVPPFSDEHRKSPNLLCLVFDDYFAVPEDPVERTRVALFTPEMADRIMRFVDDGTMPLLIHCTQGVSRSGAVGSALDWYYNRVLSNNSADHKYFVLKNPRVMPNPNVMEVMLKLLELEQ